MKKKKSKPGTPRKEKVIKQSYTITSFLILQNIESLNQYKLDSFTDQQKDFISKMKYKAKYNEPVTRKDFNKLALLVNNRVLVRRK